MGSADWEFHHEYFSDSLKKYFKSLNIMKCSSHYPQAT